MVGISLQATARHPVSIAKIKAASAFPCRGIPTQKNVELSCRVAGDFLMVGFHENAKEIVDHHSA